MKNMISKLNICEPVWGSYSIKKSSYSTNELDNSECLDILKCINLEKFGNDNLNFAAILINGHHCRNIVDKLFTKIQSEFNSKSFTELTNPEEIMNYITKILEKFEQSFINEMINLFKEKSDLCQKCKLMQSNIQQEKVLVDIDKIDNQLKSGATVAIAALIRGNIYITNIGDNQIILVEKDGDSDDIDSKQFLLQSVEHSFHNEKEIARIKEDCGLNPDAFRWLSMLSQERCHSRCIGDFELKTQYKQYDYLVNAKSSPLICKPQTNKFIPYKDNFSNILLVSSGLFYLVRELIYDTDKVPGEISRKFFQLKTEHSKDTLSQICKKVIDSFVADHMQCHDKYLNLMDKGSQFVEYSQHDDLSLFVIDMSSYFSDSYVIKEDSNGFGVVETNFSNFSGTADSLNIDLSSRGDTYPSIKSASNYSLTQITAYVDFTEWDNAVKKLTAEEHAKLDLITNIDDLYGPTIAEESESMMVSRSTTIDDNKTSELSEMASMSPENHGLYSSSNPLNLD